LGSGKKDVGREGERNTWLVFPSKRRYGVMGATKGNRVVVNGCGKRGWG